MYNKLSGTYEKRELYIWKTSVRVIVQILEILTCFWSYKCWQTIDVNVDQLTLQELIQINFTFVHCISRFSNLLQGTSPSVPRPGS